MSLLSLRYFWYISSCCAFFHFTQSKIKKLRNVSSLLATQWMAQALTTVAIPVAARIRQNMRERRLQQPTFQESTNNRYDTAVSIPRDSPEDDRGISPPTYEEIAIPPPAYADNRWTHCSCYLEFMILEIIMYHVHEAQCCATFVLPVTYFFRLFEKTE